MRFALKMNGKKEKEKGMGRMKRQALSEKQEKTIVIALIVMGAALLLSLISYACFRFETGIEETSSYSGIPALDIFNFLGDHIYLILALLFLAFGVASLVKKRPIPGTRVVYGIALFLFALITTEAVEFFRVSFFYPDVASQFSTPPLWKRFAFWPVSLIETYFFLLLGLWSAGKGTAMAAVFGSAYYQVMNLVILFYQLEERLSDLGIRNYTIMQRLFSIISMVLYGLCVIFWVSFLGNGRKVRFKLLGLIVGYHNAFSLSWLLSVVTFPLQKMLLTSEGRELPFTFSYGSLAVVVLTAAADAFLIHRFHGKKKEVEEIEKTAAEEDYSILGKEA